MIEVWKFMLLLISVNYIFVISTEANRWYSNDEQAVKLTRHKRQCKFKDIMNMHEVSYFFISNSLKY